MVLKSRMLLAALPLFMTTSYAAQTQNTHNTDDPELRSIAQVSITIPENVGEAKSSEIIRQFSEAVQNTRGCDAAQQLAQKFGGTFVRNDNLSIGDLPSGLQSVVSKLEVGSSTPLYGSAETGVRTIFLCGVESPQRSIGDRQIVKSVREYRLSEIFIAAKNGDERGAKAQVDRLLLMLGEGASFTALARQFSDAPSAVNGGQMGWVHPLQLPQAYSAAIMNDERPGKIYGPLRSGNGYVLVQLVESRQIPPAQRHSLASFVAELEARRAATEPSALLYSAPASTSETKAAPLEGFWCATLPRSDLKSDIAHRLAAEGFQQPDSYGVAFLFGQQDIEIVSTGDIVSRTAPNWLRTTRKISGVDSLKRSMIVEQTTVFTNGDSISTRMRHITSGTKLISENLALPGQGGSMSRCDAAEFNRILGSTSRYWGRWSELEGQRRSQWAEEDRRADEAHRLAIENLNRKISSPTFGFQVPGVNAPTLNSTGQGGGSQYSSSQSSGGSCLPQLKQLMAKAEAASSAGLCASGRALKVFARESRAVAPSCGADAATVRDNADAFERQGSEIMCQTCANLTC